MGTFFKIVPAYLMSFLKVIKGFIFNKSKNIINFYLWVICEFVEIYFSTGILAFASDIGHSFFLVKAC